MEERSISTPPLTTPPLIVTVRSTDAVGIVAAVTAAVARAGGNIVDLAQHSDEAQRAFGCRIEVTGLLERNVLDEALVELEATGLQCRTFDASARPKLALLCSRQLHCASDLLARIDLGELSCEVVAIVSDHLDAAVLARRYELPFHHLPVEADRSDQEQALGACLDGLGPDLVVPARYMRILPATLTERYEQAMINVHHSFLPAFIGANPYRRAHERGVKMVGATAHYVTAELDAGPIITQDVTPVTHAHDVADLVRLGADIERKVLARAVRLHLEHRIMVFGNKTCVFD